MAHTENSRTGFSGCEEGGNPQGVDDYCAGEFYCDEGHNPFNVSAIIAWGRHFFATRVGKPVVTVIDRRAPRLIATLVDALLRKYYR